jgi:alkylhydroperoxidase family enzyme
MFGLNDAEISAILHRELEGFSAPERALIRMADAIASTPANVNDELYAELRRYFSEEQLIELAADAALENFRARWNRVFDVGSDALYCEIPSHAHDHAPAHSH